MAIRTLPPTPSPILEDFGELSRLDKVLMISGGIAIAIFGICSYLYSPSILEREQAARLAMLPEHAKVCEKLGKAEASERAQCVKLLDELQTTHKQAFMADDSDI